MTHSHSGKWGKITRVREEGMGEEEAQESWDGGWDQASWG